MKRMLSATLGLAALGAVLVGCSTRSPSMDLGAALYRGGQYVAAADAFSEAIVRNPRSAEAWNNRAIARLRLGEVNAAIADFNKALELAPRDAEIYYNRANALVAAGLYQEAIADYTRAIELNPKYSKTYFNRGTAYALLGQRDAAQNDWSRAIALEPDPWAKSAMRRSGGLDGPPRVAVVKPIETQPALAPAPPPGAGPATVPLPSTPSPVAANPPVPPAAPPVVAVAPPQQTPPPQPAASLQALDARALASRAITRELEGDHAGAMQDLTTAMQLEPDPARRASIVNLMKLLDTPR